MTKFETDLRNRSAQTVTPNAKKMSNAAEDLESLLKDARTRLEDVKTASPENWIDYRRDVDHAMDRASSQYSNSEALFR